MVTSGISALDFIRLRTETDRQLNTGSLNPDHLRRFLAQSHEVRQGILDLAPTLTVDIEKMARETNISTTHILGCLNQLPDQESDRFAERMFGGKTLYEVLEIFNNRTYLIGGWEYAASVCYIAKFFPKE